MFCLINYSNDFCSVSPCPPVMICIHMRLFTTYGRYYIFCNMHTPILFLKNEHVTWTQYSEQPRTY